MSALRRFPSDQDQDERRDEPGAERVVAHLVLAPGGALATEFVGERHLDGRGRPAPAAVEALFGAWGHLDADALLDEIERTRAEAAPTPEIPR